MYTPSANSLLVFQDNYSIMSEEDYSASEEDLPFEPYDINNDGRIIKTASRCSRESWKRPEVGWDVLVTIHRFCELTPPQPAKGGGGDTPEDVDVNEPCSAPTPYKSQVEPELEIGFTLGQDETKPFPQVGTVHVPTCSVLCPGIFCRSNRRYRHFTNCTRDLPRSCHKHT